MTTHCPPETVLNEFLDDQLDLAEEDELDAHLRGCPLCRDRLDQLTAAAVGRPLTSIPPALPRQFSRRLEESLSCLEDATAARSRDAAPPEIPGYEVLEEVGGGGSGTVYRGMHRELNRPVALKVLHDRTNAAHRLRLRREAEALAALNHPAIVQVFEIGEADGRSFLALEFVPAGSLADYLLGEPQPPRPAARLVAQLADGMHAAHQAGFIHRDLKPGNVLLERRLGATEPASLDNFLPKVTDFGVVKMMTREEALTRTRDFVGTPCYMAPEQASETRHAVDERTDVYGLGAILYEVLTGRPPFRSVTPLDTLVQVKFAEPIPPRRLEPKVPRDLETICLKCLEKDPARRYASAQALRGDLQQFLAGRPVQARPIGWPLRAWRWCRRNPGWAASLGVGGAMLLLSAIAGPIIAHRERTLRQKASMHEAAALREKTRAREHLERASQALEDTLGQVLINARLQEAGLEEVRAAILRTAVPYLEEFVLREEADLVLQLRQGRALLHLAGMHAKEGRSDRARTDYQHALQAITSLHDRDGASPSISATLAVAHMEYGRFLLVNDRNATAAETHLRHALRLQEQLVAGKPGEPAQQDRLAIILSLLGILLGDRAESRTEALALLQRAVDIRELLIEKQPDQEHYQHYAALTHLNLALNLEKLGKRESALPHFARACELERQLLSNGEVSLEGPVTLSILEGSYAIALGMLNRYEEAWSHLREALRIADALVLTQPSVVRYVKNARQWHFNAFILAKQQNQPGQVEAQLRRTIEHFHRVREVRTTPATTEAWLSARLTLAEWLTTQPRSEAAAQEGQALTSLLRPWLRDPGSDALPVPDLIDLSLRQAGLLERLASPGEALGWFDDVVARVEGATLATRSQSLAQAHQGRARCLKVLGKDAEAAAAAQAALTHQKAASAANPAK